MRIDPYSLISAQAAKAPDRAPAAASARPPEPQAPAKAEFSRLEIPKAPDTPNRAQGFTQPERLGARLDIKV